MTTPTTPELNTRLIAERRITEGLTQRALAKRLGVRSPVIAALERGTNHHDLPLAFIARLADALAVTPAQLLTADDDITVADAAVDDIKLEALLAGADRLVSAEEIAYALSWTLKRTNAALQTLRARLTTTGQKLHTGAGVLYALRPRTEQLTIHERQQAARAQAARASISRPEAQLLRQLTQAPVPEKAATGGNAQRVTTSRLLRLGLAELRDGQLRLTPDARFSLGLDEHRTSTGATS